MAEKFPQVQFFLGANSAHGFSSLYDRWVDQSSLQGFYAIKGGAGCGKSTLMGRIAQQAEKAGWTVEYIRCSGDPDSLDGIYLPQKGVAMMDGTAPHCVDPIYTGATGHYVDLGAGYDRAALGAIRKEIIEATRAYRSYYPEASRCFSGAAASRRRAWTDLHTPQTLEKTEKRAAGLLARERKNTRPAEGKRRLRFLGGPTCQGRLLLEGTVRALCQRGYEIRDDCGLAGILLKRLEEGFLAGGYDVISCLYPEQPDRLEHLLIPELSLAFLTGPLHELTGFRVIRTQSLVEKSAWQEGRRFLRLSNRVAQELMEEGMGYLAQAKARHDVLEELYHPHVDFSHCQEMTHRLWEEIRAMPDWQE